ncbi:hypothetical protein B0A48_10714 [Cryoendolithus antarcticus]|uniref:Transmembrane 9 superfamily member n=1 Tax=Cryoendolithus antarcticus TaxID=1507870 RepID=A0A1V8SYG9_9PEZI|nr:hypothetical protein B0A48_10714 [Cryoendolithus antarcticus]
MRAANSTPGVLLALLPLTSAFYLPGITPTNYSPGDLVPLHVNHVTPSFSARSPNTKSVFSFDYYHHSFGFCPPEAGPEYVSESLGSILFGDRIQTSPFQLRMLENEGCRAVCDEVQMEGRDAKFVNRRIMLDYNLNWLVDGLPAGQRFETADGKEVYEPGFALGRVVDGRPQLHNHYDIMVDYHQVRKEEYRVVGILVNPSSRAGSKRLGEDEDFSADCGRAGVGLELNIAESNRITWTYSVTWRSSSVSFATRWDKYLRVYDAEVHWIWLTANAIVMVLLVVMVATALGRTLRKDIQRYNKLNQIELDDLHGTGIDDGVQEDSGWKLVHGDVFRPPKQSLLLALLVGNGAQLFTMAGFTIGFAAIGFLSPSNRGSLASVMILLYTVFAFLGGYTSSRVYKLFRGQAWKALFILTPSLIPGIVFATFFLLNLLVWARQSSGAVPFTTMLVIVGIWFLISVPLSLAGSWLGFRQPLPDPPVKTNQIPRQIPPAQGYLRPLPSVLVVGILPFAASFLELYFIMSSLWSSRIYYMFGFLFLCYGLVVVTSAAASILIVYFILGNEDYRWQWRAFAASGGSGVYVFLYCLVYWARRVSFSSWTGGVLYLGYSALLAGLWFVLSGTVGFMACWAFVHRIYGSLKVD